MTAGLLTGCDAGTSSDDRSGQTASAISSSDAGTSPTVTGYGTAVVNHQNYRTPTGCGQAEGAEVDAQANASFQCRAQNFQEAVRTSDWVIAPYHGVTFCGVSAQAEFDCINP